MISRRHGFTLIEIMITMAIMVILVAVAIVSLRGSQANGRDAKRASDIDTIARGLEQRYNNGMAQPSGGTHVIAAGQSFGNPYCHLPDVGYVGHHSKLLAFVGSNQQLALIIGTQYATQISNLPPLSSGTYPSTEELNYVQGTDDQAFCPEQVDNYITEDLPGITSSNLKTPDGGTLVFATTVTAPSKATVGNNYYYLPLDADGNLCSTIDTPCYKFTLYYVSEVDGTLHSMGSKHQ